MSASIVHLPFLTEEQCEQLVSTAEDHPDIGIDRRPESPGMFVTYGCASYLDVCLAGADPENDYYSRLAETNAALWSLFAEFYEQLRVRMAAELDGPVEYRPDLLALPGLHIFRGDAISLADHASAHFDLQFNNLRMPGAVDRDAQPITVTIPIRIPAHGTGLIVHDVDLARFNDAYARGLAANIEAYARRRTRAYHSYTLGSLVLHRGLLMHRLSSPGPIEPGDQRITVQGHAIRSGGKWILYW